MPPDPRDDCGYKLSKPRRVRNLVPGRVVPPPAAPKPLGPDLGTGAVKVMGSDLGVGAVKGRAGDSNVTASAAMFESFSD